MSIIDVADLSGVALDWAVAVCEKLVVHDSIGFETGSESGYWIWDDGFGSNKTHQLIDRLSQ